MSVNFYKIQKLNSLEKKFLYLTKNLEDNLVYHVLRRVFNDFSSCGYTLDLSFFQESVKKSPLKLNLVMEAVSNKKQRKSLLNFIRSIEKTKKDLSLPIFFKPSSTFCKSPANNIFQSLKNIIRKSVFGSDIFKSEFFINATENISVTLLHNGYYFVSDIKENRHVLTHEELIPISDFSLNFLKTPSFFNVFFLFLSRFYRFLCYKVPYQGPDKLRRTRPAYLQRSYASRKKNKICLSEKNFYFKTFLYFFRIIKVSRFKKNLLEFYFSYIFKK